MLLLTFSLGLQDVTTGRNLHGFILTGSNVRFLDQAVPIDGAAQGDIVWLELQKSKGTHSRWGVVRFWLGTALVGVVFAGACLPFLALTVASAPGVSRYIGVFHGLSTSTDLGAALVFGLVPALVISLFVALAVCFIEFLARHSGVISYSRRRQLVFQAVWVVVLVVCGGWLIVCSSILFASSALNANNAESSGVADGSIYSSGFFLIFLVNLALVAPGLQLLQPSRLWRTVRSLRNSSTPRQRFRASIPSPFHATFLQVITLVAVFYSAAFSLIFPLIGIPAFIVLLLALVALRYRVYYVHSHVGQDGGENTMWLISRFGFLICLTPLLYGLVLLSRRIWSYAAGMLAVALFSLVVVEICTYLMGRRPTRRHLPSPALTSLAALEDRFRSITLGRKPAVRNIDLPSQTQSAVDQPMTGSSRERRSSLASILNLLDRFLASSRAVRERPLSIPLRATECIDDIVSTELAAATHPSAPPHLILDPADALRPLCYPPSVLQPPVTVWLRDGDSRVGRREAEDLDHFHSLPSIVSNH